MPWAGFVHGTGKLPWMESQNRKTHIELFYMFAAIGHVKMPESGNDLVSLYFR